MPPDYVFARAWHAWCLRASIRVYKTRIRDPVAFPSSAGISNRAHGDRHRRNPLIRRERAKVHSVTKNTRERRIHGGGIFGFYIASINAREWNRAYKLSPVEILFLALCCPLRTDAFIRSACPKWCVGVICLELNAFAKTVDLSVNWSVEMTFVASHDPNIAYFWKRDSWYDKVEIIIYICGSRCGIKGKNKGCTRGNEIDAKERVINKWQYAIIRKEKTTLKIIFTHYLYYITLSVLYYIRGKFYERCCTVQISLIIVMRLAILVVIPSDQLRF